MPPTISTNVMPTATRTAAGTWLAIVAKVALGEEVVGQAPEHGDEHEQAPAPGPGSRAQAPAHAAPGRARVSRGAPPPGSRPGSKLPRSKRRRDPARGHHHDAVAQAPAAPRSRTRPRARPCRRRASSSSRPWISARAATSTPRVGSSHSEHVAVALEPAGEDDLLLVAARELVDGLLERVALHAQARRGGLRRPPSRRPPRTKPPRESSGRRARVRFARIERGRSRPCVLAVLGDEGEPWRTASRGVANESRAVARPPQLDLAAAPPRSAPKSARTVSVRPEPMSPARPRISPRQRSKLTSRRPRRGAALGRAGRARCRRPLGAAVDPGGRRRLAAHHEPHELRRRRFRRGSRVATRRPSRRTVTRSAIRRTSSSRCEM